MSWIRQSRARLFPLLVVLSASTLLAQIFPGRIAGTVRDTQGAVIPAATVKLINRDTGLERTVSTDQNGDFNFPELALGTFELTISKSGFETTVMTGITTSLSRVNTVAPVLKVGTVATQVEVTSAPPLIQTETNSAGGRP